MKIKTCLFAVLTTSLAVPVYSQSVLEEIVVTAQRREQSLQDVPVSVTAFTGNTLENLKITEASQYLQMTPNVSYTEDGQVGARGISIAMRGVSNINTDESAFIQSIGVYLDGFSISAVANATANPQLLDLERVEVLRGPQGTYFGRNSVGGALNIQTKRPSDEFGYKIIAGGHGYETRGSQWNAGAIVNVPFSDNFKARAVLFYEDNSGIVKNIVPGGGDSGHDFVMGRINAEFTPSDATTINVTFMRTVEEQGLDETVPSGVWDTDTVGVFFLNRPDGTTFSSALDDGTGFWPQNRDKVAHTAIGERNDNSSTISIINITHQLTDEITIKSITGRIDTENEKVFDNDLVPEDLVNRYQKKNAESWSTEFRVEFSNEQFDWITGFLYAEDRVSDVPLDGAPGGGLGVVTGTTTAVDGGVFLGPVPGGDPTIPIVMPGVVDYFLIGSLPPLIDLSGGAAPGGVFLWQVAGGTGTPDGQPPLCLGCGLRQNNNDSWSVFSDITWHATEQLDLTVGFRYTEDDISGRVERFGLTRMPRLADMPVFTAGDTFDDFTPRFSIGWQATDDMRLYGTVSRGYKAGGYTLDFNTAPGAPNRGIINEKFDEETLWNYEIGLRSEWLDRRLRLNISGFYLEWSDLQLETFFFTVPGDATSNIQRTINVEEAEAKGFELELAAAPAERLLITAGLGYTDTEINSDDYASISGNLRVSLKGQPLPRSPEWTWNMAAQYSWPWDGNEMYIRGEWIYRDSQFSTIEDVTYRQTSGVGVPAISTLPATGDNVLGVIPDRSDGFPFRSPDYHLVNIRAGAVINENWEFNVYVNNVFDEEYYTGTGENFGLSGFRLRPHPRYFGGGVSYSFGGI